MPSAIDLLFKKESSAGIYLLKVNNKNSRNTPYSSVSIVKFQYIIAG